MTNISIFSYQKEFSKMVTLILIIALACVQGKLNLVHKDERPTVTASSDISNHRVVNVNDGLVTVCTSLVASSPCYNYHTDSQIFDTGVAAAGQTPWLKIQFPVENTINSIYLSTITCMQDQQGVSTAGVIKVGNGATYDSAQNEICATISDKNYSRWIACQQTTKGLYLFIVSSGNRLHASELMAYSQYFVQHRLVTRGNLIDSGNQLISADIHSLNTLKEGGVIVDQGTEQHCFTIKSSTSQQIAGFQLYFDALIKIRGVVWIPRISQTTKSVSDNSFQQKKLDVKFYGLNDMTNANQLGFRTYRSDISPAKRPLQSPEHDFAAGEDPIIGKIRFNRDCGYNGCILSLCSFGVLTDCLCNETLFDSASIHASKFQSTTSLCSVPSPIEMSVYTSAQYIPLTQNYASLYDSVSLVCGNADGFSFCGDRKVVLYQMSQTQQEHIYENSKLFEFDQGQNRVVIKRQADRTMIGDYSFEVRVKLANHSPTVLYFPHKCAFTLKITDNCDCALTVFKEQSPEPSLATGTYQDTQLCQNGDITTQVGAQPQYIALSVNIQTLRDSTSQHCGNKDGYTHCGARKLVVYDLLTGEYVDKESSQILEWFDNQIILKTIEDDDLVGTYSYEARVVLADHETGSFFPQVCKFTVQIAQKPVTQSSCSIEILTPERFELNYEYVIGSGAQSFSVSRYLHKPETCELRNLTIQVQLLTKIEGAPEASLVGNRMQIESSAVVLADQALLYQVTATAGSVQNSDAIIVVAFKSPKPTNEAPQLVTAPTQPQVIPCLSSSEAVAWQYTFSEAKDTQGSPIDMKFECLKLPSIFFITNVVANVLSIQLNTQLIDVPSHTYTCGLRLTDDQGQQITYQVDFKVECQSAQAQLTRSSQSWEAKELEMIPPTAKILSINNKGLVTIAWTKQMQPVNTTIPYLFNATVKPGTERQKMEYLNLANYTIKSFGNQVMTIQLLFETPLRISSSGQKDTLVIYFNATYFRSNQVLIPTNTTVLEFALPRQMGYGKQLTDSLGGAVDAAMYAMLGSALFANPFTQVVLSTLLGLVSTLTVITHFILIELNYPANLEEFFKILFPLITLNLIPTDQAFAIVFGTSNFQDAPYNDQFEMVGYGGKLVITNIGTIMVFMTMIPVQIVFYSLMARYFKVSRWCLTRRLQTFFINKKKGLMWNGVIRFFTTSYFFLSFLGSVSLYDIRLSSQYTPTEKFSSVLGIGLCVFSLSFPLIVHRVYTRNHKPIMPTLTLDQLEKMRSEKSLAKYQSQFHTQEQHQKFIETYGGLLESFRIDAASLTMSRALTIKLAQFLSELFLILMIFHMRKIPVLAVLLIMISILLHMGYLMQVKPYKSTLQLFQGIFNLATQLYLTYLMLLFTEFVDFDVQISCGQQFLYATIANICTNILIGFAPGFFKLYRRQKFYYFKTKKKIKNFFRFVKEKVFGKENKKPTKHIKVKRKNQQNVKFSDPEALDQNANNKNDVPNDANQNVTQANPVQQGMINPKNWVRDQRSAFIPTLPASPIYTPNLAEQEAQAYVDYVQSRFVMTDWDRYPTFPHDEKLTRKCVMVYLQRHKFLTEHRIAQTFTTVQQKLILEQEKEVRMHVAHQIVRLGEQSDLMSALELQREIVSIKYHQRKDQDKNDMEMTQKIPDQLLLLPQEQTRNDIVIQDLLFDVEK